MQDCHKSKKIFYSLVSGPSDSGSGTSINKKAPGNTQIKINKVVKVSSSFRRPSASFFKRNPTRKFYFVSFQQTVCAVFLKILVFVFNFFNLYFVCFVVSEVSHFTFMREMRELKRCLSGMNITVNKTYNCVCPVLECINENEEGRGMPPLPIASFTAMDQWEAFLADQDNMIHVVSYTR